MNTPIELSLLGMIVAQIADAPRADLVAPTPSSPIERLQQWREENQAEFQTRRILGMKRSAAVRENLLRLHREKKAEWRASARKNPKLCATDQHIAAKEWTVVSPTGERHTFRNLKKWVRESENLFVASDVEWKNTNGRANQDWCRAFQGLARLRPGNAKFLPEWQGWRWCWVDKRQTAAQTITMVSAAGSWM
jgi:hypothetical protein